MTPYKPPSGNETGLIIEGLDHKNVACLVDWWREGENKTANSKCTGAMF